MLIPFLFLVSVSASPIPHSDTHAIGIASAKNEEFQTINSHLAVKNTSQQNKYHPLLNKREAGPLNDQIERAEDLLDWYFNHLKVFVHGRYFDAGAFDRVSEGLGPDVSERELLVGKMTQGEAKLLHQLKFARKCIVPCWPQLKTPGTPTCRTHLAIVYLEI
ncbi:hypothetical protein JCM33374_g3549 [Metschnikowia sp. JCM 33374]|nr:hypothetical protein JCM33374_g3549 [Metschnikowia sp. JCM 33374]